MSKGIERNDRLRFAQFIAAVVIVVIFLIALWVGNLTGPKYEFQQEVHGYMENAYWANTPELMIDQLEKCMAGMRGLGLEDDMYGKYWSWKQTPDWRMDYCYAHLEAIIDRCEEVISWRDSQDLESGQMADVYNEKMENLRMFLKEGGWSDEIAKNAYYINYHAYYYIQFIPVLVGLVIVAGLAFARLMDDGDWFFYISWVICSIVAVVAGGYAMMGL